MRPLVSLHALRRPQYDMTDHQRIDHLVTSGKKGMLVIDMDDPYVSSLITEEFGLRAHQWDVVRMPPISSTDAKDEMERQSMEELITKELGHRPIFRWGEYERVDWDQVNAGRLSTLWYMNVCLV